MLIKMPITDYDKRKGSKIVSKLGAYINSSKSQILINNNFVKFPNANDQTI